MTSLVLCDDRTTERVIKGYGTDPPDESRDCFSLLQIRLKFFVDIYEAYLFKGEVFVITYWVAAVDQKSCLNTDTGVFLHWPVEDGLATCTLRVSPAIIIFPFVEFPLRLDAANTIASSSRSVVVISLGPVQGPGAFLMKHAA